jgi:xanthine dehydrogenase iron-sulfur cluster and FAD-binding subunit A
MTTRDELTKELAVANATAKFQNMALIGALIERQLVDPAKIADWAEFFANRMETSVVDGAQEVAARLRSYARELKDIVRLPENP